MNQKLTRSKSDRILAGICAGLANFYGLNPTNVRIGVVVIGFFTAFFPILITYVVMWMIVPEEIS
jgi:phage shock protein C